MPDYSKARCSQDGCLDPPTIEFDFPLHKEKSRFNGTWCYFHGKEIRNKLPVVSDGVRLRTIFYMAVPK